MFRHRADVVGTRLGQFLLGLDVFQDDADAILLALTGQGERFIGGGEIAFRQPNLCG